MTELRNTERELCRFRLPPGVAGVLFVLFASACSLARFVYLQVISTRTIRPWPRTTASRSCRSCRTAA